MLEWTGNGGTGCHLRFHLEFAWLDATCNVDDRVKLVKQVQADIFTTCQTISIPKVGSSLGRQFRTIIMKTMFPAEFIIIICIYNHLVRHHFI
ncbi:MAG: hypothetical protein AUG51_24630 [Acidobacteria bacterium 13_1_20CM_3_53_8]|nr:MAG: hypothetical protein AUG51_24630 [Acidobacteria bacterium 13_1_20CM_3_53_8]